MKTIVLLLVLISLQSKGQTNFERQLNKLLANARNNFQQFQGELSLKESDSAYQSTIQVDGTKRNEILLMKEIAVYSAIINDSLKMKQGQKIADEWKNKLTSLIGGQFQLAPLKIVAWNPANYGWKFSKDDIWVDITVFPLNNSKFCMVALNVTHLKNY